MGLEGRREIEKESVSVSMNFEFEEGAQADRSRVSERLIRTIEGIVRCFIFGNIFQIS